MSRGDNPLLFYLHLKGELKMKDQIDEKYAVIVLIEILFEKGIVNESTYKNVISKLFTNHQMTETEKQAE